MNNNEKNPLETTTYGFGEIIKDAVQRGMKKFLIGIGGSATNDCGAGMAQALGFEFFNNDRKLISDKMNGRLIGEISEIKNCKFEELNQCEFTVACDVKNPLLGNNGAVYNYAKQKGAKKEDLSLLENNIKNLNDAFENDLNKYVKNINGAGAAGGLGAGLAAFLEAKLVSGSKLLLEIVKFEDQIKDADLIITGEGKIDSQTKNGKIISEILYIAKKNEIPVYGICGIYDKSENYDNEFEKIVQLVDFGDSKDTINNPEKYLKMAVDDLPFDFK